MRSSKEWISISDMMTGLMIVFLFISVLYMLQLQQKENEIKEIAKKHENYKQLISEALIVEFKNDLEKWDAEIIKNSLIFRFKSPDIMFDPNKSVIKNKFKGILNGFCPRYFSVLHDLKDGIEEIGIEGHTSNEWYGAKGLQAYLQNMRLSQERTRAVLNYCVSIKSHSLEVKQWALDHLTANGLSSSRPICDESDDEWDTVKCRIQNRRVEFRAHINQADTLDTIVEKLGVSQ